jgi:hypothetical protein
MTLAEAFDGPERPVLRPMGDDERVCQDCFGSLVVVDDDGSVSGVVGTLIDCGCVALSVPPGFVECHACAALIPVPDGVSARNEALMAEYLAFCERSGSEPAWCLACGEYRPLGADGTRAPCVCAAAQRVVLEDEYARWCRQMGVSPGREIVLKSLGSVRVSGPWGIER